MSLSHVYNDIMRLAFPPAELKPLSELNQLVSTGNYSIMQFDENDLTGYALIWWHANRTTALIDYFFMAENMRSSGLGGRILSELKSLYPNVTFIIESEQPALACNPELATRRINFYKRNGGTKIEYNCKLYGVNYNCFYMLGNEVKNVPTKNELMSAHLDIYKLFYTDWHFKHKIFIPFQ